MVEQRAQLRFRVAQGVLGQLVLGNVLERKPTMRLSSRPFRAPGNPQTRSQRRPRSPLNTGRTTVKRPPSTRSWLIASTSVRRSSASKTSSISAGAGLLSLASRPAICRNAGPMYSSRDASALIAQNTTSTVSANWRNSSSRSRLVETVCVIVCVNEFDCPVRADCAPGRS
jgi:hypothetical protein